MAFDAIALEQRADLAFKLYFECRLFRDEFLRIRRRRADAGECKPSQGIG